MSADIRLYQDTEALAHAAAEHFAKLAAEAIPARGRFTVALSGGSTPRPTYALLATPPFSQRIDWACVHIFWGDERCVPPEHDQSNYYMARKALLDHIPIPEQNVHRIQGELSPKQAAARYEAVLQEFFGTADGFPRFDLVLLGMGEDGHTASLFPGTEALAETARWVLAHYVARVEAWRITLSPPVLNAAAHATFLVAGARKAERLHEVLEGPCRPAQLPAQMVRPISGALCWMVDAAAAAKLSQELPPA